MFHIVFQDPHCTVASRKKADREGSRESPDVPLRKEISSGSPSSTLRMVAAFFPFSYLFLSLVYISQS